MPNHHVPGPQTKTPNLTLRNIHIFRTGQQIIRRAQKSNPILNNFQHAATKNYPLAFGVSLQDLDNQFFLFKASIPAHLILFG